MNNLTQLLNQVMCARPFDELGIHQRKDNGWQIRAWYPNATKVEVLDWKTLQSIAEMLPVESEEGLSSGLFIASFPNEKAAFHYRLKVFYAQQEMQEQENGYLCLDPYQFGEISYRDLSTDSFRLYLNQGAHLIQQEVDGVEVSGVRFAVYAPNARAVSVVGDFNFWDGRAHPMGSHSDGVWRLFVPGVEIGQGYKFEIKAQSGDVLPHKTDPYGYSIDQFPSFASRVYDQNRYQWGDQSWQARYQGQDNIQQKQLESPMSIYEVHLGSWQQDDERPLDYQRLADRLIPYVLEMGFTHIELMPVTEHPYDGSWGYQPVGLFAPTTRFGQPDEFKAFIDRCHQAGIGIILDWVPAHFPDDAHGLALFDGSPLYEYPDPKRGRHTEWNSLIYDYGRIHVNDFLVSNALFWFDHFHIDGIRVDAVASMLYLDYAREEGQWIPNVDGGNHNYEAIAFLRRLNEAIYQRYPAAITIAEESTSFPGVSKPTYEGGLGFGFKWNMGWMNDTLRYMSRDSIFRRFHHNELTFSLIYAFEEHFILPLSHDEVVHGKCSLLDKMPGDAWQKFANLRAFMGYYFAHPGKKLNFMGNEFAQGKEWDFNHSLDWHLLESDAHKDQQTLVRDLNRIYVHEPCLYELDYHHQGFRWISVDDHENSVLSFARFSRDHGSHLIIIANFTPVPRDHYQMGAPNQGAYRVLINSDSTYYGGSGYSLGVDNDQHIKAEHRSTHGMPATLTLNIPPLSVIYLKPL